MERKATEGINGGFTQDDWLAGQARGWEKLHRNGKVAQILLRPWGQAVPRARRGGGRGCATELLSARRTDACCPRVCHHLDI